MGKTVLMIAMLLVALNVAYSQVVDGYYNINWGNKKVPMVEVNLSSANCVELTKEEFSLIMDFKNINQSSSIVPYRYYVDTTERRYVFNKFIVTNWEMEEARKICKEENPFLCVYELNLLIIDFFANYKINDKSYDNVRDIAKVKGEVILTLADNWEKANKK